MAHIELDRTLPEHYEIRDLLEVVPHSAALEAFLQGVTLDKTTYLSALTTFEVWGIRSPPSKFVTVKPMVLREDDKEAHRAAKMLRRSARQTP